MKKIKLSLIGILMVWAASGIALAESGYKKCVQNVSGQEACITADPETGALIVTDYGGTPRQITAPFSIEGIVSASGGVFSAADATDVLAAIGTDPIPVIVKIGTGTIEPVGTDGELFIKTDEPEGQRLYINVGGVFERVGASTQLPVISSAVSLELSHQQIISSPWVTATAAITVSLPENQCDTATGREVGVYKTTADTVKIHSLDADDQILIPSTGLTDNFVEIGAAQYSYSCFKCLAPNVWVAMGYNNAPTEGDAQGTCDVFDSYSATETNTFAVAYDSAATRAYIGTVITPDASTDVCGLAFKEIEVAENISGLDYYFRIIARSGVDLNLTSGIIGTSSEIDGSDIIEGQWTPVTFSSDITVLGAYAIVRYAVADGAGPDGTPVCSSTNYLLCGRTTADEADMDNGYIATDGLQRWGADGVRTFYDSASNINIRVYGKLTP